MDQYISGVEIKTFSNLFKSRLESNHRYGIIFSLLKPSKIFKKDVILGSSKAVFNKTLKENTKHSSDSKYFKLKMGCLERKIFRLDINLTNSQKFTFPIKYQFNKIISRRTE